MDLGIRGRTAIVCASSQGLGKGCARALAEAGVALVINGRNRALLTQSAEEIRQATGVEVTPVIADVSTPEGQAALLAACPTPDILVNNNGGPPFRDFRELDRQAMLTGVTMNMVSPIELIQQVIGPMAARGFGRIVNITSISVKMPVPGLDLSSAARAGLTAFVAGVARKLRRARTSPSPICCRAASTLSVCAAASSRPPSKPASPNRRSPRRPWQKSRPSASAHRRNSGTPAPSCAALTLPTSPAKTSCSTAVPTPRPSDRAAARAQGEAAPRTIRSPGQ